MQVDWGSETSTEHVRERQGGCESEAFRILESWNEIEATDNEFLMFKAILDIPQTLCTGYIVSVYSASVL